MQFEHAIKIRSQPGKNGDYGRGLERVAFFPGVTRANVICEEVDAVTIGYNGEECLTTLRKFSSDLEADDLVAEGELWDVCQKPGADVATHAPVLHINDTLRARARRAMVPMIFDRRA